MSEHSAERNSLLDSKRFRELLKAAPLRAIADNGKVGQVASQEGSRGAQCEITSLQGNQPTDENQFKFAVALRTAQGARTKRTADAVLRDKEKLLAIGGKLGERLR